MKGYLQKFFTRNWQRKVVALVAATVIWFLVNHSITMSKTLSEVRVRLVGLPPTKTAEGLLPSGVMVQPMTLTLSGKKSLLEGLSSQDIEVLIDVEGRGDEFISHITRKNIASLDPEKDILRGLSTIEHTELLIKLEPLVTENIPIYIEKPVGEPPAGYQFLDIWPRKLTHTLSGPQGAIEELQTTGIHVQFDMNNIKLEELDALLTTNSEQYQDTVVYYIPHTWKRFRLPLHEGQWDEINDPEARYLHMDFLKKERLVLPNTLPVSLYFPLEGSVKNNPETVALYNGDAVELYNGISVLSMPLHVKNVSRIFLDIVQRMMYINVIVLPHVSKSQSLPWSVEFADLAGLEKAYLDAVTSSDVTADSQAKREYFRERFYHYLRELQLITGQGLPLELQIKNEEGRVFIKDISAL